MKKSMLLLLLLGSVMVHAQSLKETLYSGKLKSKPGTVIRKGDDLTALIDSARAADSAAAAMAVVAASDSANNKPAVLQADSVTVEPAVVSAAVTKDSTGTDEEGEEDESAVAEAGAPAARKSNTVLWKEYINPIINTLNTEVLTSKKVKKGSYYVLVSYTIDTSGAVTINNVLVDPENSFLQQQIEQRLTVVDTPTLTPAGSSSGSPRKVTKKYSFTLNKE